MDIKTYVVYISFTGFFSIPAKSEKHAKYLAVQYVKEHYSNFRLCTVIGPIEQIAPTREILINSAKILATKNS